MWQMENFILKRENLLFFTIKITFFLWKIINWYFLLKKYSKRSIKNYLLSSLIVFHITVFWFFFQHSELSYFLNLLPCEQIFFWQMKEKELRWEHTSNGVSIIFLLSAIDSPPTLNYNIFPSYFLFMCIWVSQSENNRFSSCRQSGSDLYAVIWRCIGNIKLNYAMRMTLCF